MGIKDFAIFLKRGCLRLIVPVSPSFGISKWGLVHFGSTQCWVWHTPYFSFSPPRFWVLGFTASVYFLLVETVYTKKATWRWQRAHLSLCGEIGITELHSIWNWDYGITPHLKLGLQDPSMGALIELSDKYRSCWYLTWDWADCWVRASPEGLARSASTPDSFLTSILVDLIFHFCLASLGSHSLLTELLVAIRNPTSRTSSSSCIVHLNQ